MSRETGRLIVPAVQLALIPVNPRVSSICLPPSPPPPHARGWEGGRAKDRRALGEEDGTAAGRVIGGEGGMVSGAVYPASLAVNTSVSCIYGADQYPIPIPLCAPEATQIHAGLRHYGLRSRRCTCARTHTRAYMHAARRRTRVGLDSRETEALCSNAIERKRKQRPPVARSTRRSINVENRRDAQTRVPIIFDLPCGIRGGQGEGRATARSKGESRSNWS